MLPKTPWPRIKELLSVDSSLLPADVDKYGYAAYVDTIDRHSYAHATPGEVEQHILYDTKLGIQDGDLRRIVDAADKYVAGVEHTSAPMNGPMDPAYPCAQMPTRHCPAVLGKTCAEAELPCVRYYMDEVEASPYWRPEIPDAGGTVIRSHRVFSYGPVLHPPHPDWKIVSSRKLPDDYADIIKFPHYFIHAVAPDQLQLRCNWCKEIVKEWATMVSSTDQRIAETGHMGECRYPMPLRVIDAVDLQSVDEGGRVAMRVKSARVDHTGDVHVVAEVPPGLDDVLVEKPQPGDYSIWYGWTSWRN